MRLLILLGLLGLSWAAVWKTELVYQKSKMRRMIAEGTWAAHLQKKHAVKAEALKANPHFLGSYPQKVYDYEDEEYLGNVTIGTPEQSLGFDCAFECEDAFCCDYVSQKYKNLKWLNYTRQPEVLKTACDGKARYDYTKSSTFVRGFGDGFDIYYGTGSAYGFLGVDTVRFGEVGSNQLVVPKTTFGMAIHLADFFAEDPIDGILGLAFTSLSVSGSTPVFINAVKQGLVDAPLFTVYLGMVGFQDGVFGGVYTWGGIDQDNCGDILAYVPLQSATYFQYQMTDVSSGTYTFTPRFKWSVISDTGTSFIGGPQKQVFAIADEMGASYDRKNEVFEIPCNATIPDIVFTIGGNKYPVTQKNLIVTAGDDVDFCYLAIFPFGGDDIDWILGDPFIREYCHIFDIGQKRIGLMTVKKK
ncbi:unnamed protein product, partial [Mesorhabditis belari]|uniref:Peptidase A1 domain-containing protein n=1 Tax=Mesorhabditis belari TaxID=2138241 RepID=A0AAF3FRE1_9BILA